jgi:nucleoside-diphosphate-sugar epimerase
MRFFLAGASGFLGSEVARVLSMGSMAEIVPIPRKLNQDLAISDEDIVILAGGYSPKAANVFDTNEAAFEIKFVESVLQMIPKNTRFVFVGSQDVEKSSGGRSNAYASHKLEVEEKVREFQKSGKGECGVVIRLGPLYGPGEEAYFRLIPEAIRASISGKVFSFKGPTNYSRNFLFVTDAAESICQIALDRSLTGLYRLGSIDYKSIQTILATIAEGQGWLESSIPEDLRPQVRSGSSRSIIVNDDNIFLTSETPFAQGIRAELLKMTSR